MHITLLFFCFQTTTAQRLKKEDKISVKVLQSLFEMLVNERFITSLIQSELHRSYSESSLYSHKNAEMVYTVLENKEKESYGINKRFLI